MPVLCDILTSAGVSAEGIDFADIEIPVLNGVQRQGDVLIVPEDHDGVGQTIPKMGVDVARSTSSSNRHMLQGDGCLWLAAENRGSDMTLGYLTVPEGKEAFLIHTDEHGANGIAPGRYILTGKREQADEIRRVSD